MKIILVGLGSIGQRHLRNLLALGYEDILLCRTGRATLANKELERFSSVQTIEEALKHKPQVAFVCTPTSAHLESALPLLNAGCHLYIEKPVSHNLSGCDEMMRLVNSKNLVTMVGFQFRFHPVLNEIKSLLDSTALGKIISVQSHWGEYLPDWHPWEDYRNSYAARKDMGGGVALTLCHPVDYMRWLFGEVLQINALVSPQHVLGTAVDEAVLYSMQFESGVIGSAYVDFVQRPPSHTLAIVAEKGCVHWDNATGIATVSLAGQSKYEIKPPENFDRNDMFSAALTHFMACVEKGTSSCIPLSDGIKSLELIQGAMARASCS